MDNNKQSLRSLVEAKGAREVSRQLIEGLKAFNEGDKDKGISPDAFSIQEVFRAFCGDDALHLLNPRKAANVVHGLMESESAAVGFTAFLETNGQIVFSKIMDAYNKPDFVAHSLVEVIQTRFNGEKIPSVENMGGDDFEVPEGSEYPHIGFGEAFIETPATTKRGRIVALTRETVFFDKTGMYMRHAGKVGEWLAQERDKRILDVIIGATNNYKRNGVSTDTYQTAAPWINSQSNPLNDWTDVDESWDLLTEMTDPDTGDPIDIGAAETILVPSQQRFTAARILNATEVRSVVSGVETISQNPLTGQGLRLVHSTPLYHRLLANGVSAANAKQYWFHGNFMKAFAYMENWPLTVVQAPPNSEAEFTQDILHRVKASERGVAVAMEPRNVIRNTN